LSRRSAVRFSDWLGDSLTIDNIDESFSNEQSKRERSIEPEQHYAAVISVRKCEAGPEKIESRTDDGNPKWLKRIAPPTERVSIKRRPAKLLNTDVTAVSHSAERKKTRQDERDGYKDAVRVRLGSLSRVKALVSTP
jgi:hypothetical protein